jgi:hypothetical protein
MTTDLIRTALTDEQKGQICGILSVGCDRETAANFVGCGSADISRAMLRDREFAAHVRRTEAGCELGHMRTVQEATKEPKNWRASVWWMERRAPERFGPRGAGQVTLRQLDEFLNVVADIVFDEIECRDDQQRVLVRMGEAIRELDQLVKLTVLTSAATPGPLPSSDSLAALDEPSTDDLEAPEEDV